MSAGFSMRLSVVANLFDPHGQQLAGADPLLTGVSTDSRSVKAGELFVALKGENFDGHTFVARAAAQGAAAALVSRTVADARIEQIVVADTRLAYGRLAQVWRRRFGIPVLALTGSNGKTTVKEMLRAILVAHFGDANAVLATEGNLNNDIGVPQMLLRLNADHKMAIFELGMNHLGEIAYLTDLVEPDIALVNMAGTAHIGELGSREAIAQAKGEIFASLKQSGIAVINLHDRFGAYWKELAGKHKVIGFGISPADDIVGKFGAEEDSPLSFTYRGDGIDVHLRVLGKHNQRNALAAAAGACSLGVPLATIKAGLESFHGVAGRLQSYRGHNSATIIDDTYNANPDSVKAAIRVLAARNPPRYLVLGDMGELGSHSAALHRDIGTYARAAGVEKILATGEMSRETIAAAGAGAAHFDTTDELVSMLLPLLGPHTTVLVKGSRFMKMERVVEKLVPHYGGGQH